ncbi:hypothetical protein LSTR_LSTR005931 [Laodelphax striatellus]|uniref:Uncharacterized protein n=1 Tax=Laodelphax striatellus TaxID=195883 RepID=A0A482WH10_LAOST|nr:hypothetical protein LSTR_LSTR005931 [Laodelphax striatellus]
MACSAPGVLGVEARWSCELKNGADQLLGLGSIRNTTDGTFLMEASPDRNLQRGMQVTCGQGVKVKVSHVQFVVVVVVVDVI